MWLMDRLVVEGRGEELPLEAIKWYRAVCHKNGFLIGVEMRLSTYFLKKVENGYVDALSTPFADTSPKIQYVNIL